jgi:hypothetical protein
VSALIDDACAAGARLDQACQAIDLSERTLQRWREQGGIKDDARAQAAEQRVPANRITKAERQEILKVVNRPEFAHMAPNQIVPALADQGRYIASESTFYRVLREAEQLTPRGKSRAPTHQRPEPFQATAPNQLWSWDITYLATTLQGTFFYLYLIVDVFSRKIVGWEVSCAAVFGTGVSLRLGLASDGKFEGFKEGIGHQSQAFRGTRRKGSLRVGKRGA